MWNQTNKQLVELNAPLFNLVINKGYHVEPSNDLVKEIIKISEAINNKPLCKTCPDAIRDAFLVVWINYKSWMNTNVNTSGNEKKATNKTKVRRKP